MMWDLFSKERLAHKRFSLEHPKDTVISMQANFLSQKVVEEWNREQAAWAADCMCEGLWLPEDIYCFDESMEWYVIFTHEGWEKPNGPELNEDDYIRICVLHTFKKDGERLMIEETVMMESFGSLCLCRKMD